MVEIMGLHDSKINALDEILEETDGKVIIWANYIYNIKQIIMFLVEEIWRGICRIHLWRS